MHIKSKIRDYRVTFVEDFKEDLNRNNAIYIVDKNVQDLYCLEALEPKLVIKATEEAKTFSSINNIIQTLLLYPITKKTVLVAIGGGVIQDITGFIASILFRGIEWIFYPTTLLAQTDSCIGSKTCINVDDKKNQVGTFYPPSEIFIDMHFLDTLSTIPYYCGLGEMIKIGLITNKGFWKNNIRDSIGQALQSKKGFIEKDEFDKNERNLLNYGHTFGHAIEAGTNYRVPHGLAVIMGMDIENYISVRKQYLSEEEFKEIYSTMESYCPAIKSNQDERSDIIRNLKFDKKNQSEDNLTLILTKGRGKMFKSAITMEEAKNYLEEYFELRDLAI